MKAGLTAIQIKQARLHRGARHGFRQTTASVTIAYRGNVSDLAGFDRGLAGVLDRLDPAGQRPRLEWRDAAAAEHHGPVALAARICDLIVVLLRWSRDPVFAERMVAARPGELSLALPWSSPTAFSSSLTIAMRILGHAAGLPSGEDLAQFGQTFANWLTAAQAVGVSPGGLELADAADARDHPVGRRHGIVQLGWGANALRTISTLTDKANSIAMRTASNKHFTNGLLADAALPVPTNVEVATFEQALAAAGKIGWPVVVKPNNLDGGIAVTTNIADEALLREAFDRANSRAARSVIVEKHVAGEDYRLLVVNGRMLIATKRTPGGVTGDGQRTVADLLDALNADPLRGSDKRSMLLCIDPDQEARDCLAMQGLTLDSVPAKGLFVRLRHAANIGSGGTAEDVTTRVHADNRGLAIQATRTLGLDIGGVDFLTPDISRSWREVGGAICEVNAQPGLRVHRLGDPGRDLAGEIIDSLTGGHSTRIPVATTVGEDNAETARLLHGIWGAAGRTSGLFCEGAAWVGDERIGADDLQPYAGARAVLHDPLVEAAVLAMPAESLKRNGHPCDRYDMAAVIHQEGQASTAREIAARTRLALALDAADPAWMSLRDASPARAVLVGRGSAAVAAHRTAGGEAVYAEPREGTEWIMWARGDRITPIAPLPDRAIPALFAAALACAQDIPAETIGAGLALAQARPESPGGLA